MRRLGRGGAGAPGGGGGDTTAPVITNLALTGNDITLNQSEGNKYYWLMNLDATQLVGTALRAAVLAGTPAKFGSNMAVVLGENLQTVSTAGLATGTWQFHIVGEDAAGNVGAFGSVIAVPVTVDIAYVGGSTLAWPGTATENTTMSLAALAGGLAAAPAQNDVVILAVGIGATVNINQTVVSAGWTELFDIYISDVQDANLSIFYKVMGAVPDISVDIGPTTNISYAGAAIVQVFRNVNTTTPIDVLTTTATGLDTGVPNPPAITPITTGAVIVVTGTSASALSLDFTSAELTNFRSIISPDSIDTALGSGWKAWTGGAFDPAPFGGGTTSINESWAAGTLALRPAA